MKLSDWLQVKIIKYLLHYSCEFNINDINNSRDTNDYLVDKSSHLSATIFIVVVAVVVAAVVVVVVVVVDAVVVVVDAVVVVVVDDVVVVVEGTFVIGILRIWSTRYEEFKTSFDRQAKVERKATMLVNIWQAITCSSLLTNTKPGSHL